MTYREDLTQLLKEVGGRYRETPVRLGTGEETHIYLDVKGVLDRGSRMTTASRALAFALEDLPGINLVTAIGGPTMGGDVLSHAVVMDNMNMRDWRWFSIRDQVKSDHGMGKRIEGAELGPEDYVIITDDVANSGKSLVESVQYVRQTGATVLAVVPLVDRSDKTAAKMFELNVPYYPVLTSADLGLENLK